MSVRVGHGLAALLPLLTGSAPDPESAPGPPRFDERYYHGAPALAPPPVGPGSARGLTAKLSQEARRLIDEVNYEMSGTAQGRATLPRAYALASACERADEVAARSEPRSGPMQAAVLSIDPALRGVRATLDSPPGTAAAPARTLCRIEHLYDHLQEWTARVPPEGHDPGPGPTHHGPDLGPVRAAAVEMSSDVGRTQMMLGGSGLDRSPPLNITGRDLALLSASVHELIARIDRPAAAYPRGLLVEWANTRALSGRLDVVLGNSASVPPQVWAAWGRVMTDVARVKTLLQRLPVPGDAPAAPPPAPPNLEVVAILDRLVGRVDEVLAVLGATVHVVPQGFPMQGEARDLRTSLLKMRQEAATGPPGPRLQVALKAVDDDYRRLRTRVDRAAGGRPGPNIDRVRQLGPLLSQLQAAVPSS